VVEATAAAAALTSPQGFLAMPGAATATVPDRASLGARLAAGGGPRPRSAAMVSWAAQTMPAVGAVKPAVTEAKRSAVEQDRAAPQAGAEGELDMLCEVDGGTACANRLFRSAKRARCQEGAMSADEVWTQLGAAGAVEPEPPAKLQHHTHCSAALAPASVLGERLLLHENSMMAVIGAAAAAAAAAGGANAVAAAAAAAAPATKENSKDVGLQPDQWQPPLSTSCVPPSAVGMPVRAVLATGNATSAGCN
jgi:hypothetical protein